MATAAKTAQTSHSDDESASKIMKRRVKELEEELKARKACASVMEKWAIHNEEWAMMERAAGKDAIKLCHVMIDAQKGQSQKRKAYLEAQMKQDEEIEAFAKQLKSIECSKKK